VDGSEGSKVEEGETGSSEATYFFVFTSDKNKEAMHSALIATLATLVVALIGVLVYFLLLQDKEEKNVIRLIEKETSSDCNRPYVKNSDSVCVLPGQICNLDSDSVYKYDSFGDCSMDSSRPGTVCKPSSSPRASDGNVCSTDKGCSCVDDQDGSKLCKADTQDHCKAISWSKDDFEIIGDGTVLKQTKTFTDSNGNDVNPGTDYVCNGGWTACHDSYACAFNPDIYTVGEAGECSLQSCVPGYSSHDGRCTRNN